MFLEVCVDPRESLQAAVAAGAGRTGLCAALVLGGLTVFGALHAASVHFRGQGARADPQQRISRPGSTVFWR